MVEQVDAYVVDDLLAGVGHDLAVAEGRKHSDDVDHCSEEDSSHKSLPAAAIDKSVDDRADHVCAGKVAYDAYDDEEGHGNQ